jgi:predicted nucleotidyltransferase
LNVTSLSPRQKVIREAANLLYMGAEKEYKQAKLKAAKTYGLHYMPTNLEIAMELDKIAEENEGSAREERLIRMRKEALKTMKMLTAYDPLLVGSVWRGAIHHNSDVDIIVHHGEPNEVVNTLEGYHLRPVRTQWAAVTKQGEKRGSFHIYLGSLMGEVVEIVVRDPHEVCFNKKCDKYGDEIKGLNIQELETVLKESPTRRFVPF